MVTLILSFEQRMKMNETIHDRVFSAFKEDLSL